VIFHGHKECEINQSGIFANKNILGIFWAPQKQGG
jgi:hypothetical protein